MSCIRCLCIVHCSAAFSVMKYIKNNKNTHLKISASAGGRRKEQQRRWNYLWLKWLKWLKSSSGRGWDFLLCGEQNQHVVLLAWKQVTTSFFERLDLHVPGSSCGLQQMLTVMLSQHVEKLELHQELETLAVDRIMRPRQARLWLVLLCSAGTQESVSGASCVEQVTASVPSQDQPTWAHCSHLSAAGFKVNHTCCRRLHLPRALLSSLSFQVWERREGVVELLLEADMEADEMRCWSDGTNNNILMGKRCRNRFYFAAFPSPLCTLHIEVFTVISMSHLLAKHCKHRDAAKPQTHKHIKQKLKEKFSSSETKQNQNHMFKRSLD